MEETKIAHISKYYWKGTIVNGDWFIAYVKVRKKV